MSIRLIDYTKDPKIIDAVVELRELTHRQLLDKFEEQCKIKESPRPMSKKDQIMYQEIQDRIIHRMTT